ncbi:MAG: Asp-tRNA(Asn)/Glu-tRNA(Gln) amidotransferase subunit GatB [Bacteroidota bacterium]
MAAYKGQRTTDEGPRYETVIGLEVHAQLKTASKAFSPDAAAFGAPPNTHVDPVSLGHPGTLPVFNAAVVGETLLLGLALDCRIARRSVLARKHYFYPDLPKGYQISQYETPILSGGHVSIRDEVSGEARAVALTRVHLEEDAGKLVHDLDPTATLVDHNRCGVPLLEIVSEPDLRTPREAALYLQEIRRLVRWLGICDGNMEEGSLRCDANVSVRPVGSDTLGTKAEVKNLNSIRGVERAIAHEAARQIALIERGEAVVQETRLWDADREETRSMRSKEEAMDYRYVPDPDLPPVVVTDAVLAEARAAIPELPAARRTRYVDALGLPAYDAALLTEERALADYFEATLDALRATPSGDEAKAVSNVVMGDVLRVTKEQKLDIAAFPIGPGRLAALVRMRLDDQLSSTAATEVFDAMLTDASSPEAIAQTRDLLQVSDDDALVPVVDQILAANPKQVADFRAGKQQVVGFFIGQVMRTFPGAPDPKRVRALLLERLKG